MFPVIPYIQALGLERDDLVQAQGMSFTVSSFALTFVVLGNGTLNASQRGRHRSSAMAVTFVGMFLGQHVRKFFVPTCFASCSSPECWRSASTSPSFIAELGHGFHRAGAPRNAGSIGTGSAGMVAPRRPGDLVREQSALDEMRIAQRLLQRRHDGDAAIGRGKHRPPFLGGLGRR